MGLVAVARSAIPPPAGAGIQLQQPTRISALSAQKLHRIHSGRRGPSLLRELLVSNVRDYAISVERLGPVGRMVVNAGLPVSVGAKLDERMRLTAAMQPPLGPPSAFNYDIVEDDEEDTEPAAAAGDDDCDVPSDPADSASGDAGVPDCCSAPRPTAAPRPLVRLYALCPA